MLTVAIRCSLPYTNLRSTTQSSVVNILLFNYAIDSEVNRTADGLEHASILNSILQCLSEIIEVLVHLKLDQILIAFVCFWGTFGTFQYIL